MTLPNEAPQLPFNRDAALAIEQAIVALRDIVSRAPGVLTFFACEAFITHELAPALEALRSASGHRAAEKCAELIALFKEYIYRRSYSGNWWNDRYSFDTMQKVEKIERAAALPETPQPATQRSEPDAAALRYLFDSTASDGQWADQAVHNFVGAMLKQAPQPATQRSETQPEVGMTMELYHEFLGYEAECKLRKPRPMTKAWSAMSPLERIAFNQGYETAQSETAPSGTAKVPEGCKLVPIDSLVNLRNGLITARAYLDGFYLDGKSPRNPLALHKLPTDLVHGAIREIDAMLAAAPSPYGNEEKGE